MTGNTPRQASLHDWLRLGEVDLALSPEAQKEKDEARTRREQIHRLPMLLRLLGGSQSLASIPPIVGEEKSIKEEECTPSDPTIDGVVARLEDVAATYSAAEGVDALVSYLVPSVGRKIGKLQPLKRLYSGNPGAREKRRWDGFWGTRELSVVASSPVGEPRKKRRTSDQISSTDSTDEIVAEEDEGDYETTAQYEQVDEHRSNKARVTVTSSKEDESRDGQSSQSFLVGASVAVEDSQESMVVKTLSEVASLVVSSLEPLSPPKEESDDKSHGNVALSVTSDSLLLEPGPAPDAVDSVGSIGGSDLGATMAALMHSAPVLRHRHVANALCRTASPQTADLISRMAANCPSASSCLIQGCMDAFRSANTKIGSHSGGSHALISNAATAAVRSIAKLSPGETGRVVTLLQKSPGVMVDLLLELCMPDRVALASLLIQHLSVVTTDQLLGPSITRDLPKKSARRRIRCSYPSHDAIKLPSLYQLLQDKPSLTHRLCMSLMEALMELRHDNEFIIWGKASCILRAFSLLMFRVPVDEQYVSESGVSVTKLVEIVASELLSIRDKVSALVNNDDVLGVNSEIDTCFELFVCSCLITCARFSQMNETAATLPSTTEGLLHKMLIPTISLKTNVFISRIAGLLDRKMGGEVSTLIVEVLNVTTKVSDDKLVVDDKLVAGLDEICRFAGEHLELHPASHLGMLEPAVLEDVAAIVAAINCDEIKASQLRSILQNLLHDPVKCKMLIRKDGAWQLLKGSVTLMSREKSSNVPVISSFELEALARKVKWPQNCQSLSLDDLCYSFLLQLMYHLCFLDQEPNSPFSIELRNLPFKEALIACQIVSAPNTVSAGHSFGGKLRELMQRHCPDLTFIGKTPAVSSYCIQSIFDRNETTNQHEVKRMVIAIIRATLEDDRTDPSGANAEKAFLIAKRHLRSSEVDTAAVGAMLASRNSPPPYITHSMLCRDPLVLLKCSVSIWWCEGLRRIALSILNRALCANDHIIKDLSRTEDAASELIVARNTVVVRCLVVAASGGTVETSDGRLQPFYCSMTVSMVRLLVARQRGIVAMLIKQGIPDIAVDWIVEFVPESISDAEALKSLLSEGSSLTAAERLKAADAALRVALVHDSRDNVVRNLVYAALSVMVSSFFLVIGPVGVPVNVLCQQGERDVTQVCRRAMFRMLSALQKVNGRESAIRNECAMALQKIVGLCKGETIMSGVAGVVATRRKNLLKEIWDAVMKAINAMGGGTQI